MKSKKPEPIKPGKRLAISCPTCGVGSPLVVRQNGDTGEFFAGCSNYPRCKHTQRLSEAFRMRAMGQKGLFDY